MFPVKAVLLDYIGTLVAPRNYTFEASVLKLYNALYTVGFEAAQPDFLSAYSKAHEKYRLVRYGELREVTNAVWVSEALCSVGYDVSRDDRRMQEALDLFFQDFVDSLVLRPYAEELLKHISENFKVGLISNFTYAPVVHTSLRQLGIRPYFDVVVVSEENGWRKPHKKIFHDTLAKLGVKAEAALYIGDSPIEDIKGAAEAGLKSVFVSSQFYSFQDLEKSGQKADVVVADLEELYRRLSEFARVVL
ncbi:MAG: HAD family hydrolase [Candidatus Bathyarchaeota archaeon]|nr:HAD family hydrolase [Candidatus Bathyarchaeota archaeon]